MKLVVRMGWQRGDTDERWELFDPGERTDGTPARRAESNFDFLNRRRSPWWHRVRRKLEVWFGSSLPTTAGICARGFALRTSVGIGRAWWELYVYVLLSRATTQPRGGCPAGARHPGKRARERLRATMCEGIGGGSIRMPWRGGRYG